MCADLLLCYGCNQVRLYREGVAVHNVMAPLIILAKQIHVQNYDGFRASPRVEMAYMVYRSVHHLWDESIDLMLR